MAIFIEEEKGNGGGWFGFGIVAIVLIILAFAIYYLFFISPQLINTVVPPSLQVVSDIKQLSNFDPNTVLNGTFYNSLKSTVSPPNPPPAGNATPFGVY